MTVSLGKVGAITMFVTDIERSTEFYTRVFGQPAVFHDAQSTAFGFDNIIINLLVATEAPELIAPATVARADGGATCQLTINVADADAAVAEIVARGATLLNGPIDRPWGQRTAAFADPDGHIWEVAADIK